MKSTKRILLAAYYVTASMVMVVLVMIIPFQLAEDVRISYTNDLFYQYKKNNGLQYVDEGSEVAKEIRKQGQEFGKVTFKELSGKYGFISAATILLLTLFLNFTGPIDCILVGGMVAILYGLGALTTESFLGILFMAFVAYKIKKRLSPDS